MMPLQDLRAGIDRADRRMFEALAERFVLVREIARYKQAGGIPMLQPQREAKVSEHYARLAREAGLSTEFGERLASIILKEAHRSENAIIRGAEQAD